jgi:hypothetical protein
MGCDFNFWAWPGSAVSSNFSHFTSFSRFACCVSTNGAQANSVERPEAADDGHECDFKGTKRQ